MKFLSWNIRSKGLLFKAQVQEVILDYAPDVLVLQECDLNDIFFKNVGYLRIEGRSETLKMFVSTHFDTFRGNNDYHTFNNGKKVDRAIFASFEIEGKKVLLVGVHFPDKRNSNNLDQYNFAVAWVKLFKEYSKAYGADSNVIFGDFNMNPWDWAMSDKNAFNGLPITGSFPKHHYYNPTWSLLGGFGYGTGSEKPPGTYKWRQRQSGGALWHAIDGLLMSPEIETKGKFRKESLQILTKTTNFELYSNGQIKYGDHLPIAFEIDF